MKLKAALLVLFLAVFSLGLFPNTVTAQDTGTTLESSPENETLDTFTDEQIQLNQTAAEATRAGDYQKAELIFRTNLELGEFNVTWLNLGRMYARAGKCLEARDAYQHVPTAPKLRDSESMEIDKKLEQFQNELNTICKEAFLAEKNSKTQKDVAYNAGAWSLFGVGLAGVAAGSIMFATNYPAPSEIFIGFDSLEEQERKEKYNTQVLVAKIIPIAVGASLVIAGSGMLLAKFLKNKKENAANDENLPHSTSEFAEQAYYEPTHSSPQFVIHPSWNGLGATLIF